MGMSIVERAEFENLKAHVESLTGRIKLLEAVAIVAVPKPKRPYHRKNNAKNAGQ